MLLIIIGSYFYVLYLPWSSHWLDGKTFWYQLFWKGNKVGFVQQSYHYQQDGTFQINQLTRVNTINRGETFELTEQETLTFDTNNNGELLATNYQRHQGDYLEQSHLELVDGHLRGKRLLNKETTSVILEQNDYDLNEYLQLMNWSRGNPQLGDMLTSRRIDFGKISLNTVVYEVIQENTLTDKLRVGFQENNRSWYGIVELSDVGTPINYAVEQRVEQRLSTKDQALATYIPADYYVSQIIGIDKPIGDIEMLSSITLSSEQLLDFDIVDDQRQYVDSNNHLQIISKASFKPVEHHDEITYLEQPYNKKLMDLSHKIVGKSNNNNEKIAKLLSFVSSYLVDAPVTHPMTIEMILQQRKGDCTEHTRLFNAMARTLDIPARKVEGLVYLGDEIQGFGGHVWSEIVIDGQWEAVDPTWNLQKLSATHIELDRQYKDELFNKMHKNSKLSFRLEKIEKKKN